MQTKWFGLIGLAIALVALIWVFRSLALSPAPAIQNLQNNYFRAAGLG